ncbi:MAG: hypothetical protein ACJ73S_32550 [Mycobacteriales bacterium]
MTLFQLPNPSASTLRSIALWRSDGIRQLVPREVYMVSAGVWLAAAACSALSVNWVAVVAVLTTLASLLVLPWWLSVRRSEGIAQLPAGSGPAFAIVKTRHWPSYAVLVACVGLPLLVALVCFAQGAGTAAERLASVELFCALGVIMFLFYLGAYGPVLWVTGLPADGVAVHWNSERPPADFDWRLGFGAPLMLVSLLSPYAAMRFSVLRDLSGLDPVFLADHVHTLEGYGLLQRHFAAIGNPSAVWISLTPAGRAVLLSHVAALELETEAAAPSLAA